MRWTDNWLCMSLLWGVECDKEWVVRQRKTTREEGSDIDDCSSCTSFASQCSSNAGETIESRKCGSFCCWLHTQCTFVCAQLKLFASLTYSIHGVKWNHWRHRHVVGILSMNKNSLNADWIERIPTSYNNRSRYCCILGSEVGIIMIIYDYLYYDFYLSRKCELNLFNQNCNVWKT